MVCRASLDPSKENKKHSNWQITPQMMPYTVYQAMRSNILEHYICEGPYLNHWSATFHCDQFMTLFMHQEFAVNAFVALPS